MKGRDQNADDPNAGEREIRCDCGNLLARLVAEGVELKCRRCKRTTLVPLVLPDSSGEEPR